MEKGKITGLITRNGVARYIQIRKGDSMKIEEAFPSAREDAQSAERCVPCKQTLSPSYRLAYRDDDFLLRDELRPVRLQLELLKPELILQEHKIENTVIVFGSARIPEPRSLPEQN